MAARYTRTIHLSWDDLHRDARELGRLIAPAGPFKGIIAIARGGLVPAAIVARELDIRLVDTVCAASYHGREQGRVNVLKKIAGDGTGLAVIDDLADTGDTLAAVRAFLPRAHFAVVYVKPRGRPFADSFITEVSQDTWIAFPWETREAGVTPSD